MSPFETPRYNKESSERNREKIKRVVEEIKELSEKLESLLSSQEVNQEEIKEIIIKIEELVEKLESLLSSQKIHQWLFIKIEELVGKLKKKKDVDIDVNRRKKEKIKYAVTLDIDPERLLTLLIETPVVILASYLVKRIMKIFPNLQNQEDLKEFLVLYILQQWKMNRKPLIEIFLTLSSMKEEEIKSFLENYSFQIGDKNNRG